MWRDELQVWMVAKHSHSIPELIWLKRYDGHPDAWYLIVYLITKIVSHPVWMQVVHALLATANAYLIARLSPFPRTAKVLIVFGYFFFFEYAAISREYSLAILGIFGFCAVFRSGPRKRYILLALLLGLMCQGGVYSVIIALCLVLGVVFEAIRTPSWRQSIAPFQSQCAIAAAIFALSVSVSVLHMRPPSDGGYITSLNFGTHGLMHSLSMFWLSFVPIPQFARVFWNSNIISDIIPIPLIASRVSAFLGLMVFCASCLFFVRKRVALFVYVCGAGALFVFKQVVFQGFLRHDGFAFILFLACLWLASGFPEEKFPLDIVERLGKWFARFQVWVLYAFLAANVAGGLAANAAAYKIPFSQARATAEFIRRNKMDQWPIIGDLDFPVSSVAGYLGRDVYYVTGDRVGGFIVWDKRRLTTHAGPVMPLAARMAAEQRHKVLVILSYPAARFGQGVSEIVSFTGASEAYENYYLYVVEPIHVKGI